MLDLPDEIVQDFHIIGEHNGKVLAHCVVERSRQALKIKGWIDSHPETGIKYWTSYRALWQDADSRPVAKRALLYPIADEGGARYGTVLEAEQLGITIKAADITVPHQFAGRDSERS